MTDQDPLFGGYEPPPTTDDPELSADRRRTKRQLERVRDGRHPLTRGPLHRLASTDAAPGDETGLPFRCGSCRFRRLERWHNRSFPKCVVFDGARMSHSAATDVRAWWPACRDYEADDNTDLAPT